MSRYFVPALAMAAIVLAKTDNEGCTSFTTVRTEIGYGNTYESVVWYVPDTLEICEGVDCGGGRAPPRNVPGCPRYSGTETATPKFLATDPAATPVSTVVTVTPTRTSTVETVTRTATATAETPAASSWTESQIQGVATSGTMTSGSAATESANGSANGTGTGTGTAALTTATPAGAGPTARAGLAAALGIAAAVALV